MNATLSGGLLLLSPVSTIFIAAAIYTEIPTMLQVMGVVLVLGAVGYQNGLFALFTKKKTPEVEHPENLPDMGYLGTRESEADSVVSVVGGSEETDKARK